MSHLRSQSLLEAPSKKLSQERGHADLLSVNLSTVLDVCYPVGLTVPTSYIRRARCTTENSVSYSVRRFGMSLALIKMVRTIEPAKFTEARHDGPEEKSHLTKPI